VQRLFLLLWLIDAGARCISQCQLTIIKEPKTFTQLHSAGFNQ